MNGEFAQVIALVAHGNLFLSGEADDFSANSTFQYVSSTTFARYASKQDTHGLEVANNVPDWFSFLKSSGATRLWNIAFSWQRQDIPEYAAVSFSGGVPIAIQTDLPSGYELWYPKWEPSGQSQKPWKIEYRSLSFPHSHAIPLANMNLVKNRLRGALLLAQAFSKRSDVDANWTTWFTKSLEILESPMPQPPYHPDLLPKFGFSLEARQVLAGAVQSYVFGGQGSWNDTGFSQPEIQKDFERITKELYEAMKYALVMSSNAFAL